MRQLSLRVVSLSIFALCLITITSLAMARQGKVTRTDGREFVGEIVRDGADQVIISIEGVEIPIPRDEVSKVEYLDGTGDNLEDARSALKDDDYEGRYKLAFRMFNEEEYELAKKELDSLIALGDKVPVDIRERIDLLKSAVDLKLADNTNTNNTENNNQNESDDQNQNTKVDKDDLLTDEQINMVKVYETDLSSKPRVIISSKVLKDFFTEYRGEPGVPLGDDEQAAFRRLKGYQQLERMKEVRAKELFSDIRIVGDPDSIQKWRQIQGRYVLGTTGCAASGCHGGVDENGAAPGGLRFITNKATDPKTVYTNFVIATSFRNSQNIPLVDYDDPNSSLLIQYSLPAKLSRTPHPEVRNWKPQLTNAEGQTEFIAEWIRSLQEQTGDYRFTYKPSWAGKKPASKKSEDETEGGAVPGE